MGIGLRTHERQLIYRSGESDGVCVREGDGSWEGDEDWPRGAIQQPRRREGFHVVVISYRIQVYGVGVYRNKYESSRSNVRLRTRTRIMTTITI